MLSRLNQTTNLLLGCTHRSKKSHFSAFLLGNNSAFPAQNLFHNSPNRGFFGGRRKQEEPLDFDPEIDYYKVLGLTKKASDKDIKNMYYKLCYEYHPDRTGGMHQEKFKEINNAYQILSDEKKKKQYDEMRDSTSSAG